MKIVEQDVIFEEEIDGEAIVRKIERAAKTCYKAEHRVGSFEDACNFVRSLVRNGHESTIEHVSISARVITNRGVSHEWVRHRVGCSYSQESTRYCNYSGEKFGNEITVVWPWYLGPYKPSIEVPSVSMEQYRINQWTATMLFIESRYNELIAVGCKPEEARGLLPNDLKTEFVTTMTLRAWRHFFKERCTPKAHPQIRHLALQALKKLDQAIPVVFEDLAKEFLP